MLVNSPMLTGYRDDRHPLVPELCHDKHSRLYVFGDINNRVLYFVFVQVFFSGLALWALGFAVHGNGIQFFISMIVITTSVAAQRNTTSMVQRHTSKTLSLRSLRVLTSAAYGHAQ